ncbi:MAG: ATP-binding cassette domain-containing protein [Thermoanaerobaculia bacterium]|nr:ATP-binding cassette domain-containing protein [Thermoanaerobaculia bacterium]
MIPLLELRDVALAFKVPRGVRGRESLLAVDGVSLHVEDGECLALVGESGSGKSTLARIIARLVAPDRGEVLFEGNDLLALGGADLRRVRRALQIVFQDTFTVFSPRQRVRQIIEEPLVVQGLPPATRGECVRRWMGEVGLDQELESRYPHQLSGGERQRVALARSLVLEPRLLIADEPVAALDLPVQVHILDLLDRLRRDHGLALLFISHDLSAVERIADRVVVMNAGRLVEEGTVGEVLGRPKDPHTRALLDAMPRLDPRPTAAQNALGPDSSSPSGPNQVSIPRQ